MRFRKNSFIEHELNRDVMAEILKVQYVGPKYTKLKIMWWNNGKAHNCEPWSLYINQRIKIKAEDYNKWSEVKL